jgi:hypothetical protein
MKIYCPDLDDEIDMKECDCVPKCDNAFETLQQRIKTLESAMQEFIKSPGLPNRHLQKFKQLLEENEKAFS